MDEMKMSFEDMISALDEANGRLMVESLRNPAIRGETIDYESEYFPRRMGARIGDVVWQRKSVSDFP